MYDNFVVAFKFENRNQAIAGKEFANQYPSSWMDVDDNNLYIYAHTSLSLALDTLNQWHEQKPTI